MQKLLCSLEGGDVAVINQVSYVFKEVMLHYSRFNDLSLL